MIILGIDPGVSLSESHCAVLQDGKHAYSRPWETIFGATMWDAAIIEWIRPSAGIYMRKGEMRPSRARAGKVLETHSAATTIRDALFNAGVAVYCVPRAVICKQAGCLQTNRAVMGWLAMHGYLDAKPDKRGALRTCTPGLTQNHDRDALMAALFNIRDPRNAQYKYTGNGGL